MAARTWVAMGVAVLLAAESRGFAQTVPAESTKVDFYRDVRPILSIHCTRCHSAESAKSGLRLDDRAEAFKGGKSGDPAIVPGKASDSLLIKLVESKDDEERMPRKAPRLEPAQIATLRRWVDEGADWPEANAIAHWSFLPPRRPPLPRVVKADVKTPVDAFIAREHEARGLEPSPEAPKRTLLRRLSLDLAGLPPTPEEISAFLADASPEAYERQVDRLLASPHYGERWGRHWLDLARFAESSGFEANALRASAWRYRDYVVKSFNEDKPYDLFLRQQIAGDELEPLTDENLVATGFLAHGRLDNNQEDRAVQRAEHLVDLVNATAAVAFGIQFGCSQCHDHKWDPITQADYYRFMGYFVRGQVNPLLLKDPDLWKAHEASIPKELEPAKALRKLILDGVRAKLVEEGRKAGKAEKELQFKDDAAAKAASEDDRKLLAELDKKIAVLEKQVPEKPQAWGYFSPATSPHKVDTLPIKGFYPLAYKPDELRQTKPRIFKRGDPRQAGPEVDIGWPAVFGPTSLGETSRTALVRWLTSPTQPLTSRVFVNFVWQLHFGRGLVDTPGDFGLRGARPSMPELLDWLAVEFRESGWSVKRLHRLIVLSSTYRRASVPHSTNERLDPRNLFLWRWTPRRLEAEAIRDSILAASGELDRTMGGISIPDKANHNKDPREPKMGEPNPLRRTLYYTQRRHAFPDVQELFDGPPSGESCPRRYVSTVSLQSLYLMNHPWVVERAKALAERARRAGGEDRARQVEAAFVLALGRPPGERDLAAVGPLLASHGEDAAKAIFQLCHALLNLNEFVYVD